MNCWKFNHHCKLLGSDKGVRRRQQAIMVKSCSAYNCTNRFVKGSSIRFFKWVQTSYTFVWDCFTVYLETSGVWGSVVWRLVLNDCYYQSSYICAISKSCLSYSWSQTSQKTIGQITARTIATALIHSKPGYCNSLLLNLHSSHINRLHFFLNSAAQTVIKTPNFQPITPILKSLHWLKIPP